MCSVLSSHDAVLSALGPTPWEAMTHTTLLRECAASTVEAMERSGVRRLSIVSSAMLFPLGGPVPSFLRFLLRAHMEDLEAMERVVVATKLDWTIARPPRLVATREVAYRARPNDLPPGATLLSGVLSWRAVAAFMLDSLENGRHSREIVGVCR
jgi:putative NADH-flavin reductase